MLRLDKIIKPWKESAALNDHINLYGFWNETAFLTKSGDLGMVLQIQGVDYESLDTAGQEYAVKRLESALKAFGQGFHVYQYLFKANRPEIPFANYDDPIVEAAVEQRRRHEMIGARGNAPGYQIAVAFEKDQAHVTPVADQDVAVGSLKRGAGHDAVSAPAPGRIDPLGNGAQPWPAVFVIKRLAMVHFLDIRLRVKPVAVLVNPMQPLRQH